MHSSAGAGRGAGDACQGVAYVPHNRRCPLQGWYPGPGPRCAAPPPPTPKNKHNNKQATYMPRNCRGSRKCKRATGLKLPAESLEHKDPQLRGSLSPSTTAGSRQGVPWGGQMCDPRGCPEARLPRGRLAPTHAQLKTSPQTMSGPQAMETPVVSLEHAVPPSCAGSHARHQVS